MVLFKRFVPVAATVVGLGLASVAFSGGCSGGDGAAPVLTDAQKEQVKKEEASQSDANNAAGKAANTRSMNPP